jgi:hypothetical protein
MDLTTLTDEDLDALQRGDLKSMSDAGFAQLLQTQQAALSPEQKANQRFAAASQRNNPVNEMSQGRRFRAAIGKAFADTGRAIVQPFGGISRQEVDEIKAQDAPLMGTTAGKLGYVTGMGAIAAPAALMPGAGSAVGGPLYGAALGALSPVGTDDSVSSNALAGSLAGLAGWGATKGLARMMSPKPPSGVQEVSGAGIPLTPGQRMGGPWKRMEDAAASIPFTGDTIKNAQRRSFEGFNAAVANRALKPIGASLPPNVKGREAVEFTESALGAAYESSLKRIGSVKADTAFFNEIGNLRSMVRNSPMPADVQQQFDKVISGQLAGKFQGQTSMTAQTFKEVESELGRLATRYASDPSVDKQLLGDALQEVQATLRSLVERTAKNPQDAEDIKAANKGWAEFKRMQRASTFLGAKDGIFSPENYMNAVKALDKSKDKSAFARGDALGQDLAEPALRIMGNTVPDSGTPFRTMINEPVKGIASAALTSPVAALYSSPRALNMLQLALSPKRPALATKAAAELEAAAPLLNALGISGVTSYRATNGR